MSPLPFAELLNGTSQVIPPENVILIFDWDDTLLCTTAITSGGNPSAAEFQAVAEASRATLETSKALADTRIITNSVSCWVQETTLRYMPSLLPTLQQMHIVSARACYQEVWPMQPLQWKLQAFKEALMGKMSRCTGDVCVIALGDSIVDIEAARRTVETLGDRLVLKTVKLKERPTPAELVNQLWQIQGMLAEIVQSPGPVSLTVDGTNKRQQPPAPKEPPSDDKVVSSSPKGTPGPQPADPAKESLTSSGRFRRWTASCFIFDQAWRGQNSASKDPILKSESTPLVLE